MLNPPSGEIRDVSDTAIWVAHYRAEETRRGLHAAHATVI